MNYLVYPTKVMKITQNHTDGNHKNCSSGSPHDFPIDEACEDTGRSWFYCPCDGMRVKRIYGVGSKGINTIWLESTEPVVMPCGVSKITMMIEHPEDDDLAKLKAGQVFKRGEKMFREGGNGSNGAGTYGNHFHIAVGSGEIDGNGWQSNGNAWVLVTTGKPLKANEAFYLDGTKIVNNGGYIFKAIPIGKAVELNHEKEMTALDNTPDSYAKDAVKWARDNGILKGDDKGNLMLHQNITRQDLIVMLYRAMKK